MKKTLIALSVLLAFICCTLAYASPGIGSMTKVTSATPSSATSPKETAPSCGVSIGTVDAQLYSSSGLNLNYFSNAQYVAQISEGTYMGFSADSGMDPETGEYISIATLTAISSTDEMVTVPDSISVSGNKLPVMAIGNSSNYLRSGFSNSQIKALTLPKTVSAIYNSYDFTRYIESLYMLGYVPYSASSIQTPNVYVCKQEYIGQYIADSQFKYCNIMPYGWDYEWMTVKVDRMGEFAQTYIEMTDADWNIGIYVKVTGNLNATDLQNIKNLVNIKKLDLSEAVFANLPDNFLEGKTSLEEIFLPESVTRISRNAFYGCTSLTDVSAPGVNAIYNYAFYNCNRLTNLDLLKVRYVGEYSFYRCKEFDPAEFPSLSIISSYAFYNTGIKTAHIPAGIQTIGQYAFSSCVDLSEVILPETVNSIDNYAFSQCSSLSSITLSESLTSIGNNAFYECKSLSEIVFPSTLQTIGNRALGDCSSLTAVKCKAIVPPASSGNFTTGVDLNHCTLYIAPFAIDAYRAAADWNNFYIMKPLNEPVKNIYINRPMTFDLLSEDNAVLQENPNMTLDYGSSSSYYYDNVGQLSASGDGTLSAGIFTIYHSFGRRQSPSTTDYRTTLVNNAENMRADSVVCSISFEKNRWHFISFQYDVQMSDVYGLNNTDFVIRQYNSINRATGDGTTSNWETVPSDGVLEAGKGYIIQAANNTTNENGNSRLAVVRFPSRNTITKNKLFTSNNVIVPLEEYPAEFAHNRSWNLVGNPYPCYYDMHYLMDDFTTPIVLWRGTSYQAYSPVDDDIILRPNEAFFVQRPLDAEQMVFGVEGRMHYSEAMYATQYNNSTPGIYYAPARSASDNQRSVFNFNIEGCGNNDRTRIVMNEEASMAYEINRDASKFFAESCQGVEIYVDGDIKYDICERPLESGVASLGTRVASDGVYSISLNGRNMEGWSVILTDTKTGSNVDLMESSYEFEAEVGTDASRFLITFKALGQSSVNEISASANNEIVRIVNISGINVYEGTLDNFTKSAPAGVYIVVAEDKTFKIVVK